MGWEITRPHPITGCQGRAGLPCASRWEAGTPGWRGGRCQGHSSGFCCDKQQAAGSTCGRAPPRGCPVISRRYFSPGLLLWGPAVLGEGLPEETTRCSHGKVPPTFYRNMEFPAFNHFLSNCHLETDQSRTDTGSPLGNFIRGTEFWLEAGTPGPQPQQALKMAGRLLKVSGARHRPCQSPKHFHIHCSMSSTKPMVIVHMA